MAAPADEPAAVNILQEKIDANPDLFKWYTDDETGGGVLWSIAPYAGKRINQLPESYLTGVEESLGGAQVSQIVDYHDQLIDHAKTSPQDFTIPFGKFSGTGLSQCPHWYLQSLYSHRDTISETANHPALFRAIRRQLVDPPQAQPQPDLPQTVENSTSSPSHSTSSDQPLAGPSSQTIQGNATNDQHWPFPPIIITSDVADDDPHYYRWYTDEKQGEFVLPFGPYKKKSVNDLPESYIMELLDEPDKLDEEFCNALVQYHNGLKQHATQGYGYAEFLVPFGHYYGGRKLSCVRDNSWLEYTKNPKLQSRYPAYFLAVERHFQLPNHQEKKRDIGEPLSRSEWDDDMELRLDRAEEERWPGHYLVCEDEDEQEEDDDEVDNEGEVEGAPQLSYVASLGQGFRIGRPTYAPSLPRLDRGDEEGGRKHDDEEDYSEDNPESARSCRRPPFQDETPRKLPRPSSYENLLAFQLFDSDEGVVSAATMSVDDVVKSEKDDIVDEEREGSSSPSDSKFGSTLQTPIRPHHRRWATPEASSRPRGRLFPSRESAESSDDVSFGRPIVDRTKSEHEMETVDISDDEPHTPVRARPRPHYNDLDDDEVIGISSGAEDVRVSRKRGRDTEEPEVETPRKRNKGKGKMKGLACSRFRKPGTES